MFVENHCLSSGIDIVLYSVNIPFNFQLYSLNSGADNHHKMTEWVDNVYNIITQKQMIGDAQVITVRGYDLGLFDSYYI